VTKSKKNFFFFPDGLGDEPEVVPRKEGASSRFSSWIAASAQYDVRQ
jgi:hypothetical protein